MRIKYSGNEYWIDIFDDTEKRWESIRAHEAPEWVIMEASKEKTRSSRTTLSCVKGGGLYFRPDESDNLVYEFAVRNPHHTNAMRLHKSGKRVEIPDEYIYPVNVFPPTHPWAGGVILPRYCKSERYNLRVVSRTYSGSKIKEEILPQFELRDYQERAVSAAIAKEHGVIRAPCGAGKTAIGVGLINEIGRSTLILVHTGDLAAQWKERIESWLPGVSVCLYGLNKKEVADVTIATVQTLSKKGWCELYELCKDFGVVILDEAHHAPASTFCYVLSACPGRYRFGLTATPKRADGLTPFLHWCFGPEVWSISHHELEARGLIRVPSVRLVHTLWSYHRDDASEYSRAITALTIDEMRNETIIDIIKACHDDGRSILVLSERVGHCEDLADRLSNDGVEAVALVGSVSHSERGRRIEALRAGEVRVATATQLADEGLDISRLDTLIQATPTSSVGRLEQRVGRIMRPHADKKEPIVYDVRDAWGPLRGGARKRDSLYRKMGISECRTDAS